ncbi:cell wall hydrolase [Sphingomicrobium nitratireducens]|uniref:cell wall hydrolase n=1 Tax=Sphingomicrobium nitratireducens TaxID=2964666 RepID=UPI00223F9A0F
MTLRTALLIAASLTASSVAPAQVADTANLAIDGSAILPGTVAFAPEEEAVAADLIEVDTVALLAEQAFDDAADTVEAEAEIEQAVLPQDLPGLVAEFAGGEPRDEQMECLAKAVYFEARGESLAGQLAVGEVIANRAESRRFPATYCGVVTQRSQFSFVKGGRIPEPNRGSSAWRKAVAIARIVDGAHHESQVAGALFFHARRVSPGWRLNRVGTVGNHVFYN